MNSRIDTDFGKHLRKHLTDSYPSLQNMDQIIAKRSEEAKEAYHDYLINGVEKNAAYKHAMNLLFQGYEFSKFEYVEEILLEYFPEKIDWRRRKRCIREYVVQLDTIFSQFEPNGTEPELRQSVIAYLSEN